MPTRFEIDQLLFNTLIPEDGVCSVCKQKRRSWIRRGVKAVCKACSISLGRIKPAAQLDEELLCSYLEEHEVCGHCRKPGARFFRVNGAGEVVCRYCEGKQNRQTAQSGRRQQELEALKQENVLEAEKLTAAWENGGKDWYERLLLEVESEVSEGEKQLGLNSKPADAEEEF